jgi:hypothetical protein
MFSARRPSASRLGVAHHPAAMLAHQSRTGKRRVHFSTALLSLQGCGVHPQILGESLVGLRCVARAPIGFYWPY